MAVAENERNNNLWGLTHKYANLASPYIELNKHAGELWRNGVCNYQAFIMLIVWSMVAFKSLILFLFIYVKS